MERNYELEKQANQILAEAGLNIWGYESRGDSYLQRNFESRMKTGAYRNNSERRSR
jgi:hypothetical protein